MNNDLNQLNASFGLTQVHGSALSFIQGEADLPIAILRTEHAEARVMLQGAQIIHYQVDNQPPIIWVGEEAKAVPGKSLRGGVPVCWPWFGAGNDGQPAHGFARNVNWQVAGSKADDTSVTLTLELLPNETSQKYWPHDFRLSLEVQLADSLKMTLMTEHRGTESCTITQALHTYLRVGDIAKVSITGLADTAFLDKTRDMLRDIQNEAALRLNSETDRVYLETDAEVIVEDAALQRRIHVRKDGSRSTVVWNPWDKKADGFPDMRADEYAQMLCIETTNAADDKIQLAPGETHCMVSEILVTPLKT
ncbi:MAG TPA: D-hexose-6-phosphate mutarotase [bacterium]|nr:D-hexose-6-phosphate mutarotase [bacterium]